MDGIEPSLFCFYGFASYLLASSESFFVAQATLKGVSSASGAASIKACGS